MKGTPWTEKELKQIRNYFDNRQTLQTVYFNIHKINPLRTFEAIARKIRELQSIGNIRSKILAWQKLRIGYLDIEANNLNGNFGFMLSWYIKRAGQNQYDYAVITKKEIFEEQFDLRLTRALLKAFKNYDVLYTHYGSDRRFDVPFIRTRAYEHSLEEMLPEQAEMFIQDTYPIARNKLKLHSNRLDSIAEALGIKGVKKTPLSGKIWMLASVGNPKALEYIATHNKRDVQILERVHNKLKKIENPRYTSI